MPLIFRRVSSSFYAASLKIECEQIICLPEELTRDDITFTQELPRESFIIRPGDGDGYDFDTLEPTHRLSGNYSDDFSAAARWSLKKINQFGYAFGTMVANGEITGPYYLEDNSGRGVYGLSLILFADEDIRKVKERFPFIDEIGLSPLEMNDAVEKNRIRMSEWHQRYGWVPRHEKLPAYCRDTGIIFSSDPSRGVSPR